MNKQDKLLSLLERKGWNQSEPPEGVSYRFRIYEYYKDTAYSDCYYALGMVDALGVTYKDVDDYLEGKDVSEEAAEQIEKLWKKSEHKRHLPVTIFDDFYKQN